MVMQNWFGLRSRIKIFGDLLIEATRIWLVYCVGLNVLLHFGRLFLKPLKQSVILLLVHPKSCYLSKYYSSKSFFHSTTQLVEWMNIPRLSFYPSIFPLFVYQKDVWYFRFSLLNVEKALTSDITYQVKRKIIIVCKKKTTSGHEKKCVWIKYDYFFWVISEQNA